MFAYLDLFLQNATIMFPKRLLIGKKNILTTFIDFTTHIFVTNFRVFNRYSDIQQRFNLIQDIKQKIYTTGNIPLQNLTEEKIDIMKNCRKKKIATDNCK